MAITLNKHAAASEAAALRDGIITDRSSPRVMLYDISAKWRRLYGATRYRSGGLAAYSEQEEAAAALIVSALVYLRRIGCCDIETLLKAKMLAPPTPRR